MARCHECWYEDELCVCDHTEDDRRLADDYIVCMSGGVVHPQQKRNAERWVRLVSLRTTGDPSRLMPGDPQVWDAAVNAEPGR